MNSKESFIKTYEKEIKPLREEYYKSQIIKGLNKSILQKYIKIINNIPLVLTIIICIIGKFSIKSKIVAIVFIIVISYLLSIIKQKNNIIETNYASEIRKLGFLSISQYEKNIEKYITGENGYYAEVLNNLINKNNFVKEDTYEVKDLKGNTYLIYDNKNNSELMMINNSLKELPKLTRIKDVNIRYYRKDPINNRIIFKTDLAEWYYNINSEPVFRTIIPEKKIEEVSEFNVAEYVSDFERFIQKYKEKDSIETEKNLKERKDLRNKLASIITLLIISIVFSFIYKEYKGVLDLIYILLILITNSYLIKISKIRGNIVKNENEYIKYINHNKDCQDRFAELKLALNIPKETEKIYSDEGAEFLVWNNARYFHLFLNLIYFKIIYISVKINDVDYYKIEGEYCELKIKGQKYIFKKEAKNTFDKLLPNKDYDWIKGLK